MASALSARLTGANAMTSPSSASMGRVVPKQEVSFSSPTTSVSSAPSTIAYDEQLQEDVYLGKFGASPLAVPVKNTFIHINIPGSQPSMVAPVADWHSSPTVVLQGSFHTKYPTMEIAHQRGECKPCAYHVYKPDGCRQGDDCPFCHLCTRGEIKRRKREKARILKAENKRLSTDEEGVPPEATASEAAQPAARLSLAQLLQPFPVSSMPQT